jgi:hypothetical protein
LGTSTPFSRRIPTNRPSEIDAPTNNNGNNAAVSPNAQRGRIIVDASAHDILLRR